MFEDLKRVMLITDMDGTFLPASKVPGKKSLEAVKKFQSDGGKFSIATGRAIQAANQYFEMITVNCPIVLNNGGLVYDIYENKSLHDVFLPDETKDAVKEILDNFPNLGCEVPCFDEIYIPQINEEEKKHLGICKVRPVMSGIYEIPENWYKVLFAASPKEIDEVIAFAESRNYDFVDFVRSTPNYYEILPKNISKGSALLRMKEICGMENYTIVAVGDYNNDIEMLKAADIGICPSNSADAVKEIADIVLDISCEEDVIAHVIDYIYKSIY